MAEDPKLSLPFAVDSFREMLVSSGVPETCADHTATFLREIGLIIAEVLEGTSEIFELQIMPPDLVPHPNKGQFTGLRFFRSIVLLCPVQANAERFCIVPIRPLDLTGMTVLRGADGSRGFPGYSQAGALKLFELLLRNNWDVIPDDSFEYHLGETLGVGRVELASACRRESYIEAAGETAIHLFSGTLHGAPPISSVASRAGPILAEITVAFRRFTPGNARREVNVRIQRPGSDVCVVELREILTSNRAAAGLLAAAIHEAWPRLAD